MTSPSNTDTKERILDAAVGIVLEKGFSGVGINEILKAVNVPKGSFYHWFASKEQFGVELLRYFGGKAISYTRNWLGKREALPNAFERIVAYYEARLSMALEKDCQQACLVCKLTAEVSSWSDAMRAEVSRNYEQTLALMEEVIAEGQTQRTIRAGMSPAHAACILHDVWLGAYLRATTKHQVQPLREALQFVKSYLAP